jgi:AraC family transcriptional regulator
MERTDATDVMNLSSFSQGERTTMQINKQQWHLSEDLGLVELASEVGLSPSHFASLFRKTTGLSPHHYVIQRRLKQAQQLLKSTRLSIGEIATAVGFYDQSHLVRHMRRVMGVTPTYIRKNLS